MSLGDMRAELRGAVPKIPYAFSLTLINRAWKHVRESSLWSFNLFESSWISPPPINAGTVTVTQGSTSISFDPTATAALNAGATSFSAITQRQFRIGISGIYNIVSYNSSTGVATLDRLYGDASGTGSSYTVYQVYYVPPMLDFLTWLSVRNMQMFLDLELDATRAEIDARDPQRSWYAFPTHCVPWGTDTRIGSPTLSYPMFELWGQATTPYTYQCYGIRRGVDLVNPTDTLPPSIGEDLVLAKAREYAYEWSEANKDMAPRLTGPDFRFLMGKAQADFKTLLTKYRKQDKEFIDNWKQQMGVEWSSRRFGYYNSIAGVAGPYAPI